MKKEFVYRAIGLPLFIGMVAAVLFCSFLSKERAAILPIASNTALATFNELSPPESSSTPEAPNALLGILEGEEPLPLRLQADEVNRAACASVMLPFETTGCRYIRITANHADIIGETLAIDEKTYTLTQTFTQRDEAAVLATPAAPNSLIVYYQAVAGYGFTGEWIVKQYQEATAWD